MFQFSLRRLIKLGALSLALTASIGHSAVREGFNNSTAPNWTITGNSRLTAPNIDPEGQGWLRLNPLATSQTGRALLTGSSQALASNVPVYFEFEYVSWGGTGADGLVAFLYDADKDMAGARSGGSLGYCGGSGAYLAIGLDEYGNFSGPYDRDVKVCRFNDQANTRSQYVDSVVIRGPEGSNYPMVATKKYASGIDFPRATARPAATKVQVSLQPATVGYNITVTLIRNGVATKMFDNVSFPYAAPNNVRVGFGSATGLDTNVHEVRGQVLDVLTEVDVAKRLTSSDPAARGSTVSYSVSYANVSNFEITAGNIQYEDIVPAEIENVSWTCSGNACPAPSGNGNIQGVNQGSLQAGELIRFDITGRLSRNVADGQTITNTAKVSFVPNSPYSGPEKESSVSFSTQVTADMDVAKTLQTPTPAARGSNVSFEITYTNRSAFEMPAGNIRFEDAVPAEITNVSWTCAGTGCPAASGNGSIQRVNAGPIAAGGTVVFTVSGQLSRNVTDGQTIANTAKVSFEPASSYSGTEKQSTATVTARVTAEMDVAKTLQSPTPAARGSNVSFRITYTNRSGFEMPAGNIRFEDTVPAEITNVGWTCAGTGCPAASGNGSIQTVNAGPIAAGGTVVFTVSGQLSRNVTDGQTIANTAKVSFEPTSSYSGAEKQSTATVTARVTADMDVAKTLQSPTPAERGSDVSYKITYTNRSAFEVPAGNVRFEDTVPADITNVSWTCAGAGCPAASGTGSIQAVNRGAMAAGATVVFTVSGKLSDKVTDGQTVTNTAKVGFESTSTYSATGKQATATLTARVPTDIKQVPALEGTGLLIASGALGALGAFFARRRNARKDS